MVCFLWRLPPRHQSIFMTCFMLLVWFFVLWILVLYHLEYSESNAEGPTAVAKAQRRGYRPRNKSWPTPTIVLPVLIKRSITDFYLPSSSSKFRFSILMILELINTCFDFRNFNGCILHNLSPLCDIKQHWWLSWWHLHSGPEFPLVTNIAQSQMDSALDQAAGWYYSLLNNAFSPFCLLLLQHWDMRALLTNTLRVPESGLCGNTKFACFRYLAQVYIWLILQIFIGIEGLSVI